MTSYALVATMKRRSQESQRVGSARYLSVPPGQRLPTLTAGSRLCAEVEPKPAAIVHGPAVAPFPPAEQHRPSVLGGVDVMTALPRSPAVEPADADTALRGQKGRRPVDPHQRRTGRLLPVSDEVDAANASLRSRYAINAKCARFRRALVTGRRFCGGHVL